MKPLQYLLPASATLVVRFTSATNYSLRLITRLHQGAGVETDDLESCCKHLSRSMVFLVVCGIGVTSRSRKKSPEIIEKILSERDVFIATSLPNNDTVCFVRRDQLDKIEDRLTEHGITLIDRYCIEIEDAVNVSKIEQYTKIEWSDILRPTIKGSTLAMCAYKRVRLVALIAMFVLLLVNFLVNSSLSTTQAELSSQISAARTISAKSESMESDAALLVDTYKSRLTHKMSALCDRIGILIPDSVMLRELSIQKPIKSIQTNKEPVVEQNQINICGVSSRLDQINRLTTCLQNESFTKSVQLTSLDHNSSTGIFTFLIRIGL